MAKSKPEIELTLELRADDLIRLTFPMAAFANIRANEATVVLDLLTHGPTGYIEYSRIVREGAWIREIRNYDVVDLLSGLRPGDETLAKYNNS